MADDERVARCTCSPYGLEHDCPVHGEDAILKGAEAEAYEWWRSQQ